MTSSDTARLRQIESAYALVALLMEVPTGAFSDRQSRKWSLILASMVSLPVVPVIILSDSFPVVLVAMSVGGISAAFVSGTDESLLYDTLRALGREGEFKQVLGKSQWYGSLAMAISGVIGGLLAQIDLSYAWWAYFVAGIGTLIVKFSLREPPFFRDTQRTSPISDMWGRVSGWRSAATRPISSSMGRSSGCSSASASGCGSHTSS